MNKWMLKGRLGQVLLEAALKREVALEELLKGLENPKRVERAVEALLRDPPPPRIPPELDWSDSEMH
jgi:hypothetical protein